MTSNVAVILAGGKGQRLRPYSVAIPKPLMPIGEMTILELIIRQLVRDGFERIVIAVNHQASLIMALFSDGAHLGTKIEYSLETEFLGTFGPLTLVNNLPEHFIVTNGDVLTDISFSALLEAHRKAQAPITVAATVRKEVIDFGVLEVDNENYVTGIREKPSLEYLVSMGIYGVSASAILGSDFGRPVGFDEALKRNITASTSASASAPFVFRHLGYWKDIGRPDDYLAAVEDFETLRGVLLP